MNRRQLLKLLVSGVVGSTIDVDRLLWTPGTRTIFIPSPKQVVYLGLDWGIPYHESNASVGTWMGIVRTTEPIPFRELLKKATLDPKEGLYVIDTSRMGTNVGSMQTDGIRRRGTKKK
jgi:hypothetical protein